jgi:hypothetical protein
MIQLKPLRESLEYNPTVLRVYRSVSLELEDDYNKWILLCNKISTFYYQLGGSKPKKVRQAGMFASTPNGCSVNSYPIEFIPIMINIIKEHLNRTDG